MCRFAEAGESGGGPALLVGFLVSLVQRDMEVWWRERRRKEAASHPLLYYLLEGEGRLLTTIPATVIGLYRGLLASPRLLGPARRLLAASCHLAAHQDARVRQAAAYTGAKAAVARAVAGALAHLPAEELELELALLQPPWLGWLASRVLVERREGVKVDSLTSLMGNLALDKVKEDTEEARRLEVARSSLAYRLVSCRHLHTLHSLAWSVAAGAEGLAAWRGLERLPPPGEPRPARSSVRWKSEVAVDRAELVQDLNTVLEVAGGTEGVGEEVTGSSTTKALLFRRTSPTDY